MGAEYTPPNGSRCRTSARLVPARAFLAETASAGIPALRRSLPLPVRLAVALTMLLAVPLALSLRLSLLLIWLRSEQVRGVHAAVCVLSLRASGRRIRSLIHFALLVTFVYPRMAGSHIREPLLLAESLDANPRSRRRCG